MSAIVNVGSIYPALPPMSMKVAPSPAVSAEASASVASSSDSVEISRFGQALSQAAASQAAVPQAGELSSLSLARIQAFRSEIERGTFETQARIDGTVSRLLDFLK